MRGYFGLGQLSASEKQDILNQHKSLYNGYQTMQPQVSNTQPLYVYDPAGDKDGVVVNNKGEVKKYTNFGINEQVEQKEVCDECGAMIADGVCECNYGHMEESEMNEEMCECGGKMYEGTCNECGSGRMEEETGHLDDIYKVRDLNLKKGDYDYVEGGGNDYGTFEGMHKNLYKEDDGDDFVNYDDNMKDDDFEDYESSYTEDGFEDPDNEDDGFEDLELDEQGGNADDMDVDDVEPAYDFESNGPIGAYPVNEDDMYGYEPEKTYETMESAWADEELEMDEQDVSGVQGIYGDMEPPYDFDSDGPGKAGPYQEFSYESELEEYDSEEDFGFATHSGDFGGDDSEEEDFGFATHSGDFGGDDSEEDEWEEIDVDMKESFITQKNKISEMFNRLNKFN